MGRIKLILENIINIWTSKWCHQTDLTTQIERRNLLDSCNVQDSFQIYCKKRQPKTVETRYDCKEEVKTDECNVWIKNANYIIKFTDKANLLSDSFA